MADPYDEGLPRIPIYPDGTRLRIRSPLPSLNWRADPHRGPFYEIPQEAPMIDLDKPLYDEDGVRWHVLRLEGGVFKDAEDWAHVVSPANGLVRRLNPHDGRVNIGKLRSSICLSNTPPKPDWTETFVRRDGEESVRINYGRRNGKLFAEVVE